MPLVKIEEFICKHHILSLATCKDNLPQSSTLFFAYSGEDVAFIIASDKKTEHIRNILENDKVSGTIALETKVVGKIEGIQFKGAISAVKDKKDKKLYFHSFPYAIAMNPTLWKIKLTHIKLTDNKLGFATKLIWNS